MKQTRDHLVASGHFERLRHFNREFTRETLEEEAARKLVNARYGYKRVAENYLSDGCIALILGESDEEARKSFGASVEYALRLVGAPPTPGGGVRFYEANVELSEERSRLTSLHEKKPQPGQEG